jgi:tetratricopeptide (TPR) repeat protein
MEELTADKVPERARDYYKKGLAAFRKGNLEYTIEMMTACLDLEPGLLDARKVLREAEVLKASRGKVTAAMHVLSSAAGMSQYLKGLALLKSGKAMQSLAVAEVLLRRDVLNLRFIQFFADAAKAAGLPHAVTQTVELVRGAHPRDPNLLRLLGQTYLDLGQMKAARETYEELCKIVPNDFQAKKLLKDATALASITGDGWQNAADKGGTYREMIKDTEETVLLEKESKAHKSDQDAEVLIRDAVTRLQKEPENINYYRALARLYLQVKRFDEGISVLEKALEISSGDPEVYANLSAARVQKMDNEISSLREAGREEAAASIESEKNQFIFDDLTARIRRYPNDLSIRYELGVLLMKSGQMNEAIQQFQVSQRSAKHRLLSLYSLAMCFKQKRQYDMAMEQLATADSESVTMDETKKMIVYELGAISEMLGDKAKALDWFKKIYQVDIGYRDVAAKVEHAYR